MRKLTTEEFISKAKKVHGDKYDYSQVEYVKSTIPVTIICPIHGPFEQRPDTHLLGGGCQKCAGNARYTTETFIESAREIHGDKYDYSKVDYVNITTEVVIICPIHGPFKQTPHSHLQGEGCKYCARNVKYTKETFIEAAKKVHGNKYDYSKIDCVDRTKELTIICPIHGPFKQKMDAHLTGSGCQKCGGNARYTTETFIEAARKIHGDRYDYSKVNYVNNKTKVIIICPEHGEFKMSPNNHLIGHGCRSCKKSKLTKQITDKLEQNNIEYTIEKQFDWLIYKRHLRIDIYLPKYNVAIECHGLQHFEPVKYFGGEKNFKNIIERDKIKKDLCEANSVKLFYFSNHKKYDYELGRVYSDVDELINEIINDS